MIEPDMWTNWDDIVRTEDKWFKDSRAEAETEVYFLGGVNYSVVLGLCANCGQYIYEGEGDSTVHYDGCWNEFRDYLMQEADRFRFGD